MKRSAFTVLVHSDRNPNEVCLYHTLNDNLVRISQTADDRIEDFFRLIEQGKLDILTAQQREVLEALMKLGFILPDESDDIVLFEQWFRYVLKTASRSYAATILTTMSCNLRCPYCYEQGLLSSSNFMSADMAGRVSAWLQRQIVERGVERMNVVFFGGEPLLNCEAIERVGRSLSDSCQGMNVGWKAGVVTNGTLLTGEVAELIASAGVSWAKVTLDGDREYHDRLRPNADGRGTFDRIWANLAEASQHLKLVIGGNIDETNIGSVPRLLDRLARVPWRDAIICVRFKPIQWSGKNTKAKSSAACQLSAFTDEQVEWMIRLREEIESRGLPVDSDPNIGPCDFYRPNVVSVGVDGSIYPCGAFVGQDKFVMGNVTDGELTVFGREVEELRAWDKRCYRCPYLPLCAGGCRAAAYFERGDIGAMVCDREFYNEMLPRYISSCNQDEREGKEQQSMFG